MPCIFTSQEKSDGKSYHTVKLSSKTTTNDFFITCDETSRHTPGRYGASPKAIGHDIYPRQYRHQQ